ncbi:MAG: hypothetical protein P9M13_08065 [Candidatus Ancaeobacter aquaticus]|nr:hypothetical protein [Candidatus Ancaeobacter aquaticus]
MIKKTLRLMSLLIFIVSCMSASYVSAEIVRTHVRPDPKGTPTEVLLDAYIVDIFEIDSMKQSFSANCFITAQWKDERLANKTETSEGTYRKFPLRDHWNPRLFVFNQKNLKKIYNPKDTVTVTPDGEVIYLQSYIGDFSLPMELKKFPFDKDILPIKIIAAGYTPEQVKFSVKKVGTGRSKTVSIADWEVGDLTAEIGTLTVDYQKNRKLTSVDFTVPVKRYSSFYIFRLIIPLIFIVFMSFIVFWVDPKELGPQLGVAATSMLTIIAFQYAVSNSLPRIYYLTRLDLYMLGSTMLVFFALVEAITTSVLAKRGKDMLALSIDKRSRVLFPAAFIALFIYTLFLY